MTATITRLPTASTRRRVAVPSAAARLSGAVQDLREIAAEHEFDRDGVREIAARILRIAEELQAAEMQP